ncbi:MAG: lipid-A-disaccharide synthase [Candidatus Omnitrophota bacterium]
MNKNILIIAGEASGDVRGSELLRELVPLLSGTHFWGVGGNRMEEEGVELIEHIRDLSMVGIVEILKKLPQIRAHYNNITSQVIKRKPELAILIDYPGFNLKIAKFLKKQGIPVIYYIIPQVWAWGPWRIKTIKERVSKALVLFDFEEKLLKESGVDCEFVGHPLVDEAPSASDRSGKEHLRVALLPGSRNNEINAILPVMLDAAEKIRSVRSDTHFIVAESSNIQKDTYDAMLSRHENLDIERVTNDTFSCLDKCDFAIVASGTATLETAVMERPMVITYKVSPVTAFIARLLQTVPFLGLVNIIAGKEVAPELLQEDATSEKLSGKALEILGNSSMMDGMKKELREVKHHLGEKGAAKRAALAVKNFINKKSGT